ncbi:MAG: hypothetical protein RIT40_2308 [Planctomycetota bacterium]
MPPEALTPIVGPTMRRISATSAAVAPPLLKPVEVFTKSAPAAMSRRTHEPLRYTEAKRCCSASAHGLSTSAAVAQA